MEVKDFGKLIPDAVIETLKESISKAGEPNNYWIGLGETPRNNLELFTLKSIGVLFPHVPRSSIVGLEWWFHVGRTIKRVPPHFDCDEQKKMEERSIVSPLGCSVNYLTSSAEAPTVITNVEPDWFQDGRCDQPTEVTYSFPGAGKTITFGPRYLHGVKSASLDSDRITLMCNVWDHRPSNTIRCLMEEELYDFELMPQAGSPPVDYTGPAKNLVFPYFGHSPTLPYPVDPQPFDTLRLQG